MVTRLRRIGLFGVPLFPKVFNLKNNMLGLVKSYLVSVEISIGYLTELYLFYGRLVGYNRLVIGQPRCYLSVLKDFKERR